MNIKISNIYKNLIKYFLTSSMKNFNSIKKNTLNDKNILLTINLINKEKLISKNLLINKKNKIFYKIATKFNKLNTFLFNKTLWLIWKIVYNKILWNKSELLKTKTNKIPLILIPSHRSHVDYLIISQILKKEDLEIPYIAAGDNLSFFPIGFILRRSGAFFIKRSFKKNILYKSIIKSYINNLINMGFTQEFFIEGTRSRTGKTLFPKFGILSIIAKNLLVKKKNAIFLPISILYENTIEKNTYSNELIGHKKIKENNINLLKSINILKYRYGNIYINFIKPIIFSNYEKLHKKYLKNKKSKKIINLLSHKIISKINYSNTITPHLLVSIIFIGLEKKLISYIKIKNSIQKILSYLENKDIIIKLTNNLIYNFNKEIIFSLKNFKNDKILSIYTIKKNIYYKIIKKNSLFIDYHKNNIIYYLIMETFIASSIIYSNKNKLFSINSKNLIKIIKKIIYILKYEFIYEFNFSIENKILDILYKESIYKKNIFLNKKCIKNIRFLNNQIKNLLELYLISTLNIKTLIKSPPKKKILINNLFKYIKIYNKKNKNLKKILPNKYLLINSINFLTNTQLIKISKSKSIILSPNFEFKSKKIINFLTKILIKTHKF